MKYCLHGIAECAEYAQGHTVVSYVDHFVTVTLRGEDPLMYILEDVSFNGRIISQMDYIRVCTVRYLKLLTLTVHKLNR